MLWGQTSLRLGSMSSPEPTDLPRIGADCSQRKQSCPLHPLRVSWPLGSCFLPVRVLFGLGDLRGRCQFPGCECHGAQAGPGGGGPACPTLRHQAAPPGTPSSWSALSSLDKQTRGWGISFSFHILSQFQLKCLPLPQSFLVKPVSV